jgi:transmembrane sensor
MKVTKELVMLYFNGKCTLADEQRVEKWLAADPENTNRAMQWMDETDGENDATILNELLLSRNEVWANTEENITEQANRKLLGSHNKRAMRIYIAAAAIVILTTAFGYHWYKYLRTAEVATAYGQIRNVILPDSSSVVLNGNSKVKYCVAWNGKIREIWLEGEAFFNVRHLADHTPFRVHLSGKKDIEVLGTEFNVIDRVRRSCVVLKSGSIRLSLPEKKEDIYLQPGDLVEMEGNKISSKSVRKVKVDPETYSAWTKGRWKLDGTTLQEILLKVEENYGIEIIVENKSLLEKRASGSLPLDATNSGTLIEDIAHLFRLQLTEKNNKVLLTD